MPRRVPRAAAALIALTATGLLLSGCHVYHRAHHGKPYYAAPAHGYHHVHGKGKKHRHAHHRRHRGPHGHRGHH